VFGTDYTWTDGTSGNTDWTEVDNWGGAGYPDDNGDTATFDNTWTSNCDVDSNITCGEITLDTGYTGTVTQSATMTVDDAGTETGDLTITEGTWTNGANTLNIDNDLTITDTFGDGSDTGDLTIGGSMSGTGTYTHGNQNAIFEPPVEEFIEDGPWTFYDLTANGGYTTISTDIIVEHTLTINSGKRCGTTGSNSPTITIGTALASGEIANAGTFYMGNNSGESHLYAADAAHYADLTGAGIYDWDYQTGNDNHWKWLDHQGTDATAKTTGGGGVTIVLDGTVAFYEDWTAAANDTFDVSGEVILINKDLTEIGTVTNQSSLYLSSTSTTGGIITDWSCTKLKSYSNETWSFDGTVTSTGDVEWNAGKTGPIIAYDSASILNATGDITVPAGAYLGADAAGDMGDGNPASGWSADMSFGSLTTAGNTTFSSGNTTITSDSPTNYMLQNNGGAITHNDGTITMDFNTFIAPYIDTDGDNLYDLVIDNAGLSLALTGTDLTLDNDLDITTGRLDTFDGTNDWDLTVTNTATIAGILTGHDSDKISFGGGSISSGGEYDATTEVTEFTGDFTVDSGGSYKNHGSKIEGIGSPTLTIENCESWSNEASTRGMIIRGDIHSGMFIDDGNNDFGQMSSMRRAP